MKSILVWDWSIRVSHWLMVLLFTGLIITGRFERAYFDYHFYLGYSLSALVVFRVIYGFYGSRYAKFSQFIKAPKVVVHYLRSFLKGKPNRHLGHNPLGALMVVALLIGLTLQWGSGLFTSDDLFWTGPLNAYLAEDWQSWMAWLHHVLPDILLWLVGLHVAAVFYHELCLKERLVSAMIHGKKRTHQARPESITTPRWGVLFALLMGGAWLVWLWLLPV
ncbi:cytochrome b/b6 domain-containing protein [Marinomonas pollencensis]|uniref:Cytochrome b n=1 Tax=Marinomonas pollencensis TaxID=491954 RepID=A0A3E0DQA4_9GAMM|nr:cytochrome b/b6 domain-containing protein [Marinomonas pollencensis]REG85059.1 cytochrome b [Marinomonas pollencensis]